MHGAHRPEEIGVLRCTPGVRATDLAVHTVESKETAHSAREQVLECSEFAREVPSWFQWDADEVLAGECLVVREDVGD